MGHERDDERKQEQKQDDDGCNQRALVLLEAVEGILEVAYRLGFEFLIGDFRN